MSPSLASIKRAAKEACELAKHCCLCARACSVSRFDGQTGKCGVPATQCLANVLIHHGEEPVICGAGGAAAFFFSGCTLDCIFCQNWQISRVANSGEQVSVHEMAEKMHFFQQQGCSHLDFVSPIPHLPWIFESLALARENNCILPAIINTNGYISDEIVGLCAQACEIMLLDVKFSSAAQSEELCKAADYAKVVRNAFKVSAEKFGPLILSENGLAQRGLLVRHLVLPGYIEESIEIIKLLATEPDVTVSLMSQYHPSGGGVLPSSLKRKLSCDEYYRVVEEAGRAGLNNLLLQEPDSSTEFLPDFDDSSPFSDN